MEHDRNAKKVTVGIDEKVASAQITSKNGNLVGSKRHHRGWEQLNESHDLPK